MMQMLKCYEELVKKCTLLCCYKQLIINKKARIIGLKCFRRQLRLSKTEDKGPTPHYASAKMHDEVVGTI